MHNPWSFAAWFAFIGTSTYVLFRANQLTGGLRFQAVFMLSLIQLGLGLFWAKKRNVNWGRIDSGWKSLVLVLLGLQLAEQALVVHSIPSTINLTTMGTRFIYMVFFIGLVEEVWFRGLWMHLCKDQVMPALVVGSVVFGLYHLPHGPWVVISTAGVGFAFGAARLRGASLFGLGLLHGANNWLNQSLFPGTAFRYSRELVAMGIAGTGIVVGLWLIRRAFKSSPSTLPVSPGST